LNQVIAVYDKYKEQITHTKTLNQLRQLRDSFHQELHVLSKQHHMTIIDQLRLVNDCFDLFIKHTVVLTENMLNADMGLPVAPVPYAFVLFGSAGRREQVLGSDQDNGLIYKYVEDSLNARENDFYFTRFSELLTTHLLQLGYPECSGRVLSCEAKWRKDVRAWRAQLQTWMEEPNFEHVRNLLVIADGRCLHGEKTYFHNLREQLFEQVKQDRQLLSAILRNTLHRKVLIGVFGNLIREQHGFAQGGIDLKYGAYVPFVNAIRLLAIHYQLTSSSTFTRMNMLAEQKWVDREIMLEWRKAFENIIDLRAQTYLLEDNQMYVSEGKLKAEQLTEEQIVVLKKSMKIAKKLQKFTQQVVDNVAGGSSPWI
jgi:CBS domain-containing protein